MTSLLIAWPGLQRTYIIKLTFCQYSVNYWFILVNISPIICSSIDNEGLFLVKLFEDFGFVGKQAGSPVDVWGSDFSSRCLTRSVYEGNAVIFLSHCRRSLEK